MSDWNFKGQSSVEYLSIVAIALMVLIPGSYLFLNYSRGATEQVSGNQLNLAGREILAEAEKMHVVGTNSWVTLDVSLPGTFIEGAIVDGQEFYFKYGTRSGESYTVFFPVGFQISNSADAPCVDECDLGFTVGLNKVRVQSQGGFVSIVKK